jgi:hypothetical protein
MKKLMKIASKEMKSVSGALAAVGAIAALMTKMAAYWQGLENL